MEPGSKYNTTAKYKNMFLKYTQNTAYAYKIRLIHASETLQETCKRFVNGS
jgi:hypothetical protein